MPQRKKLDRLPQNHLRFCQAAIISFVRNGDSAIFSLLRNIGLRHCLERELAPFVAALVIADIWFKWGSFALELVGFVVTWFVLGFVADIILRTIRR